MSCINYKELSKHVGHKIVCVRYLDKENGDDYNISIECETCNKVIFGYDKYDMLERSKQLCI